MHVYLPTGAHMLPPHAWEGGEVGDEALTVATQGTKVGGAPATL